MTGLWQKIDDETGKPVGWFLFVTMNCGSRGETNVRSQAQQSFTIDVIFPCWPNAAHSFLRLAAIQYFERVKDSAGLAPKCRFIAAEPIKSEVGKVGETQKATGELDSGSVGFHLRVRKCCYVAESTE